MFVFVYFMIVLVRYADIVIMYTLIILQLLYALSLYGFIENKVGQFSPFRIHI